MQGFLDGIVQLVLIVAYPLGQDVINNPPAIGIPLFHAEHDAVTTVVAYINCKEGIVSITYAAEIEFFEAVVDLDQLGKMDVFGEV